MLDRLVDDNGGFKSEVEQIPYDYTKGIVGDTMIVCNPGFSRGRGVLKGQNLGRGDIVVTA